MPPEIVPLSAESLNPQLRNILPTSLSTNQNVPDAGTSIGRNISVEDELTSSDSELFTLETKNGLRIMSLNCQSIVKKGASLELSIDRINPDIICGTESWLRGIRPGKTPSKDAILSSEIFPPQFTVYRNDRDSTEPGGGVFIAIHKSLNPWTTEQPDFVTECEIIWCRIHIKGTKPLFIGCYYMAHRNLDDLKMLEESLHKLRCNGSKNVILCGDFNSPDINWESKSVQPSSSDIGLQQYLLDITTDFHLIQTQPSSTRADSRLDLVFTTNESIVQSSITLPGISDHDIVVTNTILKPSFVKKPPRKMFKFARADWDSINTGINNLYTRICEMENSGANIDEQWSTFKETLGNLIDSHIPHKMVRFNKPSLPWVNLKIKRMLKKKEKLFHRAKQTKDWTQYRKHQKFCRHTIRKAEWDHINNSITEGFKANNSKPFWKYVKSRRTDNSGVATLKTTNGSLLTDPKNKAEALINQFKSVFTPSQNEVTPQLDPKTTSSIPRIQVYQQGVTKLLKGIQPHKAAGPDAIPNLVLKQCAETLAPILTMIFQKSLDTGTLPKDWLDANIAPIYKKGDRQLPENYRPVSLTCVTCKLLEHIVCKELMTHLEAHNLLTTRNHGFRSGFSCETQLTVTLHDLFSSFEANRQTDVAILDFSKAFDTVPHKKLLAKLHAFGIQGPLLGWFECFLTKRTMKVVVDGKSSNSVHVASGVPQGTVLGPILFLIHINDLPDCVQSQVRLFADDCLLYRNIDSQKDHAILQNDLKKLEEWANQWGMKFNASKCYIMTIKSKSSHFYELGGQILQQVKQSPYLGVLLSDDLKWTPHIEKIAGRASSTLGFLRRNLRHCPPHCRQLAYISLVRSNLEYAACVWDPYLQKDINRLEQVQRKAIRFIADDYRCREEGFITSKMDELGIPTLEHRRKAMRLSLFYKIVNDLVPAIKADDYLTKDHNTRRRGKPSYLDDYNTDRASNNSTRNNSRCFKIDPGRTEQFKHSFFPRTTIDWNHLDDKAVSNQTLEAFKQNLNM